MSGTTITWIAIVVAVWLIALLYRLGEYLKARTEESARRAEWYRIEAQRNRTRETVL